MPHSTLTHCRFCTLPVDVSDEVLNLGTQTLTGTFPANAAEDAALDRGPIRLLRCPECGLVQLGETYDLVEMYGDNYGYRSGLNAGMVRHLRDLAAKIAFSRGAAVWVDIGSNDGTLLNSVPGATRIGFDPTAKKFREYYARNIEVVEDFFKAETFRERFGSLKADVVTSIACFYDLPDPQAFVNDVASILAPDGIWYSEQSYLPAMLAANAYDTVCHEHLEYYGLQQIRALCANAGMRVVDVSFNDTNGGSFAFTASRTGKEHAAVAPLVELEARGMSKALDAFANRVSKHRRAFRAKLLELRAAGKVVCGLGASTKGNVLLQACGIGPDLITAIGEVNPDKFGKFTPGTLIPIVSEAAVMAMKPDVCVVLPWHFRDGFLSRRKPGGPALLFPLPNIEMVTE
jgi:NDP-4-keto-2,6-dideoxyhexose 3-C-methyltransferase